MHEPTAPPDSPGRERPGPVRAIADTLGKYDPFIGPQLVVAAAIALNVFLPKRLTIVPVWLLPSVEGALLLALTIVTPHPRWRSSERRRKVAIALIALVSASNLFYLVELSRLLLHGGQHTTGRSLIFSGVALWGTNVLLFGLWYWELDRGGPLRRSEPGSEKYADFLFSQMADAQPYTPPGWLPGLIDYLWLSFTTATAFSPTDTMPLTQSAKLLMAVQSLTSLLIVVLVVSRAVNILS